jgi:hypothetical protein
MVKKLLIGFAIFLAFTFVYNRFLPAQVKGIVGPAA